QVPKKPKRKKRRRRNVNCLKNTVIWYEDHKNRCPYEPHLSELDPTFGLYTTAVWQCEAGHRYFQDLHSPLKPLTESENESDEAGNGVAAAGSSHSSSSSSSSESEEPPESGQAKSRPPPPAVPEGGSSSGLITQEGIHIPFEHHIENLTAEQGAGLCHHPPLNGPESMETVVCVPVPVQMSSGHGTLFETMTQEALGEVVASCPVQGMMQGSQVIIIAGPGYNALTAESIQLSVTGGGGEELPCTMIEGVAAYTQTEPENGPLDGMEAMEGLESIETKKGKKKTKNGPLAQSPSAGGEGAQAPGGRIQVPVGQIPYPCFKPVSVSDGTETLLLGAGLIPPPSPPVPLGVREFTCETCGKSFKRKNHLEVHRRTHTGETPLQCEICGYQCRQRASLNWHMKKHTSDVQYNFTCEHCGKRFEKGDSVKFHKLKSHPEHKAT
uniref:Zinc finger protein 653 n=1 Tax=Sphenodon punctatus TaxID=8508 RepID=A0A8D0GA31_SPHPU